MTTLATHGLTYAQRGGWRLGPVSLSLDAGVTALVGLDGAGKTTLLRLLAGVLVPDAGTLSIEGAPVATGEDRIDLRARVGHLPQRATWPGRWRARHLVDYAGQAFGLRPDIVGQARATALDRAGAAELAEARLAALTGGQRQRVYLAAALVHDPEVVLLDEPTVGLEPADRIRFRRFLERQSNRRTIVLSTADLADVALSADRVIVLEAGRVTWHGSVAELESLAPRRALTPTRAEAGYLSLLAR